MCAGLHALIRTYEAGSWYLACVHCPHRILEGRAEYPAPRVVVIEIPSPVPEEKEQAA